jgi:large subunit ribosomal protein L9
MKVLLLRDVYKLGRAGDVKKVADGFGRNYLIPQGFAMLATPGAMKQIDVIRKKAVERRIVLNNELSGVAELIQDKVLTFASKAGDTGKLYGSITNQMIVDALNEKIGTKIERRQIEIQPIRNLGEHQAVVRLTVDLNPTIKIIVHREGETVAEVTTKKPADKTVTPSETTIKEEVEVEDNVSELVSEEISDEVFEETEE